MAASLDKPVTNIFAVDELREREEMLWARLEGFETVVITTREKLELPGLSDSDLATRSVAMLIESVINDTRALGVRV